MMEEWKQPRAQEHNDQGRILHRTSQDFFFTSVSPVALWVPGDLKAKTTPQGSDMVAPLDLDKWTRTYRNKDISPS